SAGLAIALRDFVTAVAGWLFLLLRKPFEVGDRIEIGGYRGDVIDVRIFKFTLVEIGNWVQADQSTGRIIHLPNNLIIQETITNYTRGFRHIWNEIEVLVTFESDWRRAKRILTEIAERQTGEFTDQARNDLRQAASRYMLYFTHLTPIVYTRIADSGVLLTLRHICPPRRRRGAEESIAEEILTRFAEEPEIDLAYPTTRLFRHDREGKTALRPGTETRDTEPDPD
ncbi:MAG: mechanosensitive ion channel family protein, partial [Thermoanaerobaculia bacterium]|nr:mechanosensitive ion channel family protein [Thermoanaerobaculia bacterium]